MIPLTKTFELDDYRLLAGALSLVEKHDIAASQTSIHRRWEYAMALTAVHAHCHPQDQDRMYKALDVGGANSPLRHILRDGPGLQVYVADPKETQPLETMGGIYDVVTCVSVLEHVPDIYDFCHHLERVTKPGGLLFLTMDIWDHDPSEPDTAHFNWLRKRIFTPGTWQGLTELFLKGGWRLHGEVDWRYHGDGLFPWGY